jgi:hypothetical protein
VDHEVENDVDIEGAGSENAEAVRFKKHGASEALGNGQHSRIEALKVTRLDEAAGSFRTGDEIVCLGDICGQRFFNQHVDARVEQLRSDRVMMDRGNGHAGRIEIEIGGQEPFNRRKDGNLVLLGGFLGASRIWFDRRDKRNAFTGRFQFAVDAEMIAAECACARNCNAQLASAGYFAASFSCEASGDFPWTALRQRP